MNPIPLCKVLAEYDLYFPERWRGVFADFSKTDDDRIFLAGPSSYLFSLAGQKFAVDPQIRRETDFLRVRDSLAADFASVSFILITHPHADHMCLPLMNALRDTPIRWYIPAEIPDKMFDAAGLHPENVIRVCHGDEIRESELTVRVFNSCHVRPGRKPYPQCGYEICSPAGNILMPVDVRDYRFRDYPDFGEVDLCVSHVWAGDDAVHPEKYLPMLQQFAGFSAQFRAKRYFLCHLYEIGRPEEFLWHHGHAAAAAEHLHNLLPDSTVEIPDLWQGYPLFV